MIADSQSEGNGCLSLFRVFLATAYSSMHNTCDQHLPIVVMSAVFTQPNKKNLLFMVGGTCIFRSQTINKQEVNP